jgi:cysteinyl-tRNA synthetase
MTAQVSLFNTLTRRVEPLVPLAPPRLTLYTCGPTVWNYAHIGNFRTFLFEDLLRRWLEHSGFEVFQIMNLTDVDDRTRRRARQGSASPTIRRRSRGRSSRIATICASSRRTSTPRPRSTCRR